MTSDIAIRVSNLSKCYHIYARPRDRLMQGLQSLWRGRRSFGREFWALKDISFEVGKGECLGILGRNGAGKSTLLQLIASTLEPTQGTLEVNGMIAALLELGSGFNPEFTGRENVYLNASILGLSTAEIDRKFDEIAAFADIGDFIEQPVKNYSSGMMMRLAFAVQTAVEPDILIVDEALAVGDARFQKKCFDRMQKLRENGGTILLVTHDSGVVVQICDRALIVDDGRIYDQGKPQWMAKVYHKLLFGATHETRQPTGRSREERPETIASQPAEIAIADKQNITSDGFMEKGDQELRYGSHDVEICEIGIRDETGKPVTILDAQEEYDFYFTVRYNQHIGKSVSFGFIITNVRGVEIFGTKGGLHDLFIRSGMAGEHFECVMRVPMMLTPGMYFLSVAVAPAEESESEQSAFYDFRFDALQFQVIGNARCFTTSLIDLNAKLSFNPISE